jgi:hypothetical protein
VVRVAVVSSVLYGRLGGSGIPVAGHPFAAGGGGMEWYGRSQAGSIKKIDRAGWGSDTERPRAWLHRDLVSRCSGQATDVAVAQPVVDQREQFAGGSDLADVGAASLADTDPGVPEGTLA